MTNIVGEDALLGILARFFINNQNIDQGDRSMILAKARSRDLSP